LLIKNICLLLFVSFLSYGQVVFGSSNINVNIDELTTSMNDDIALFEKRCGNGDTPFDPDKFLPIVLETCETELTYLEERYKEYEYAIFEHEEVQNVSVCLPNDDVQEIVKLMDAVKEVPDQVQCLPEEIAKKSDSCGKVWTCNVLRSVFNATTSIVPKPLVRPVRKFVKKKADSFNDGCLSEGKSDCVQEFVSTILGSLLDTGKALWEMAKASAKSIFNVSGWFDGTSDKMHKMATQTAEEVGKFWDSPGDWIFGLTSKISNSVKTWIKEGVMCQKWKGAPHMSKCEKPLRSFDCIDCETQINAVCSAAGGIISEVGIMALTAGTGTVASIGARVGVSAMKNIAKKTLTKIDIKKPKFLNKKTKVAKKPSGKLKSAAIAAAKLTASASAKMKGKLDKYKGMIEKVKNSRRVAKVAAVVSKVTDVIVDPSGVGRVVSEKAFIATNKLVNKVKSKVVTKVLKKDMNLISRAENKAHLRKPKSDLSKRTNSMKMIKTIKLSRKLSSKHTPGKSPTLPGKTDVDLPSHKSDGGKHADGDNKLLANNENKLPNNSHNGESGHSGSSGSEGSGHGSGGSDSNLSGNNSNGNKPRNNSDSEIKVAKDDKKHNKHDDEEGHDGRPGPVGKVGGAEKIIVSGKLAGVAVAADVITKVESANENAEKRELEQSRMESKRQAQANSKVQNNRRSLVNSQKSKQQRVVEQKRQKAVKQKIQSVKESLGQSSVSSNKQLANVLGMNTGNTNSTNNEFRKKAVQKIEKLERVYSARNKQSVINQIKSKNKYITDKDASELFESRKGQISSAKNFLAENASNKPSFAQAQNSNNTNSSNTSAQGGIERDKLSSEISEISKQVSEMSKNRDINVTRPNIPKDEKPVVIANNNSSPKKKIRSVSGKTNSGNPFVTSFNSTSNSNYDDSDQKNYDKLGTLHPEIIAKNEDQAESVAGNSEKKDIQTQNKDAVKEARFSYKDFMKDIQDIENKPEKLKTLSNVVVETLNDVVASETKLNDFKVAVEKYGQATSLDIYKLGDVKYEVYTFLGREIFGISIDQNGARSILEDDELSFLEN
jgi:hypothetical protein